MSQTEGEPTISQISISQPLEDALIAGSAYLEGRELDVSQLLSAVLTEDGLGKRSMEVVLRNGKYSQVLSTLRAQEEPSENTGIININGSDILVTSRVSGLLAEAGNQAKGSLYVDTGHIVQAELNRIDSVLRAAIDTNHTSPVMGTVLFNFIDIARKENKYPLESKANYQVQFEPTKMNDRQVVDLIAEFKSGDKKGVFINPEWTLALIQSVTSNPITVVMTEHEEELRMAIQGLAAELSDKGYVDIPKIIVPNASTLIDDPEGTIATSVREAKGGILVLPNDARYLTNKALRLALERGEIRIITSSDEVSWTKSKGTLGKIDAHELYLSSPTEETLLNILKAQKEAFESQYRNGDSANAITISDEAFRESAKLGYRYASAMDMSPILAASKLLETAAINLKLIHSGMGNLLPFRVADDMRINSDDVYMALKTATGIEIQPEDPSRFLKMEVELKKHIIGQDEAIKIISDTVRRSETALKDPKRPRGVFMFLGPSGVGKTELAKSLNDFIFHDSRSFIQINMSEYQEQHAVARLIGSPPGYVGYEEGGQLTEKVRKQPYSILVVDEMEKANAKVFDIFLQVFEEGVLTDGKGRAVDFSNTLIILTGNIGSGYFSNIDTLGYEKIKEEVLTETKQTYRPEFLNRIDSIIVFKPLTPEAISEIVDLQIQGLNKRLEESQIKIELTPEMHKYLEKVGYDPENGARPLRRAVENEVGNEITPMLLSSSLKPGDIIVSDFKEGKVDFSIKR